VNIIYPQIDVADFKYIKYSVPSIVSLVEVSGDSNKKYAFK
jgi:hypothetical protein